jgi:lipopolysaccharide export system protein LptA
VTISNCNPPHYLKRSLWSAPIVIIFLLLSILVYAETSSDSAGKENAGPAVATVGQEAATSAETSEKAAIADPVAEPVIPAIATEEKTPAAGPAIPDVALPAKQGKAETEKTTARTVTKPVSDRIAMESDKAVMNRAERIVELEGNVKVSQGETVITSNLLRLFLKEGATLEPSQKNGENAIEKVVAIGNVIFKLEIGIAYADRAEYATATKLLVLTGKEPKFVSGKNTITGSKITVNRESGMVTFEGGGKSRVEAVIYSKEKL